MADHVANALKIASDLRKAERRVDRNPTDGQKDAGTYKKGHLTIHGMPVTIENPKGSERSGIGKDGKRWSVRMPASYGYVKGSEGADGDHVDVYIGPDHASDKVFVVDQIDAETGKYDEHKCLLSFKSKSDAVETYKKAFSDGKGEDRIGAVTEMSVADFKDWLKSGDTTKPVGELRKSYASGGKVTRETDMPLIKGFSRDAVSKNIKAERDAGKPRDQAIAIAMDVARRAKKRAKGGAVVAMNSDIAPTYDYYMRGAGFEDKDGRPLIDPNSEDYKNQQRFLEQVLRGPNAQNGKAFRFQMEDGRYDSFGTPSFKPPQAPRSRYADGGDVGPDIDDLAFKTLRREQRATQRKALAGLDPELSDAERESIAARMPAFEDTDRAAEAFGGEFTGIPSMVRGAVKVKEGRDEGDVLKGLGGVGEFALGAMPLAGATRAGAPLIRPFFETAPRAVGTMTAATLPGAMSSDAEARDKSISEAVLNDPAVKALKTERQRIIDDMARVNAQHAKSGKITHETAVKPYTSRLEALDGTGNRDGEIAKAEAAARDAYLSSAPFRERYPGVTQAIMAGGAGYAAGVPLVKELVKRGSDRFVKAPNIRSAADEFNSLLGTGKTAEAAQAQDELRRELSAWDRRHGPLPSTADAVGNMAKGAAVMAEASSAPEQLDYLSFGPGHPAREQAAELFRKPEYYFERLAPAVAGAGMGVAGQTLGHVGAKTYPFANERMLADIGGRGTPYERMLEVAGLNDRSAGNVARLRTYETETSPKALKAKDRLRQVQSGSSQQQSGSSQQQSGYSQQQSGQRLADEAAGLEAGAGTGSRGPTSVADEVRPELVQPEPRRIVDILRDQRSTHLEPVRATETNPPFDAPKPTKEPSKRLPMLTKSKHDALDRVTADLLEEGVLPGDFSTGMYQKRLQDVKVDPALVDRYISEVRNVVKSLEAGGIKDPTPAQIRAAHEELKQSGIQRRPAKADGGPIQDETKHHSHYQPRELGKFAGGPVYPSYDRGGTIQAAMDVARKYAGGGSVHVGPVVGETGGRSDKLPIDVPAGAFVVPADVVSALGEGNSLAGCKNLDRMMGDQRSHMANGGQAVPIKISDGEYVVSPEAVAKLGNGDMDVGHRALEKFVTTIRKQHIAQLQKLPPPAR